MGIVSNFLGKNCSNNILWRLVYCRKEVIDRCPEEFKIRCLKDIQSLFGGRNPFFAGYGNRPNVRVFFEYIVPLLSLSFPVSLFLPLSLALFLFDQCLYRVTWVTHGPLKRKKELSSFRSVWSVNEWHFPSLLSLSYLYLYLSPFRTLTPTEPSGSPYLGSLPSTRRASCATSSPKTSRPRK